jgi:FtsH-binding integral membrane protein
MRTALVGLAIPIAGVILGFVVFAARGRQQWRRHLLVGLGLLFASGPLGVIVTLALLPMWRWLEESYAIESVGHSGPAAWCYLVSVLGCLLALGAVYVMSVVRGRAEARGRTAGSR